MSATIRVGTRGSKLATTQAGEIARLITERTGTPTELVRVTTHGDTTTASLASLGGSGVFASALREALLAGECDLVVHSMKDLPTAGHPGLTIGAVPARVDPRDALCARDGLTLAQLPAGATVGTGSPRRAAQIAAARPDLDIRDLRGNVDTRLGFVRDGVLDAVILAAAGLGRLGWLDAITEYFDLETHPNAPAQGALALEVRSTDLNPTLGDSPATPEQELAEALRQALAAVNDPRAFAAAEAERAVLAELEAGCAAPIGAAASWLGDSLRLVAQVTALDGGASITLEELVLVPEAAEADTDATGALLAAADGLGRGIARQLLKAGAGEIAPLRATKADVRVGWHDPRQAEQPPTVLLPTGGTFGEDAIGRIRSLGAEALPAELIRTEELGQDPALVAALEALSAGEFSWLTVTSARTVPVLLGAAAAPHPSTRIAAVGPATAQALKAAGFPVHLTATAEHSAAALVTALDELWAGEIPSAPVLALASAAAAPTLSDGLRGLGATVQRVDAYRSQPAAPTEDVVSRLRGGGVQGVFVTSGGVARALSSVWSAAHPQPETCLVVAIGEPSAAEAAACDIRVDAIAPRASLDGLLEAWTSARHAPAGQAVRPPTADPVPRAPRHGETDQSLAATPQPPTIAPKPAAGHTNAGEASGLSKHQE